MKYQTIKLIYPKHFVTCFEINQRISSNDLIQYLTNKGILISNPADNIPYNIYGADNGSYTISQFCMKGDYYLLTDDNIQCIEEYRTRISEQQKCMQQNKNKIEAEKQKCDKKQEIQNKVETDDVKKQKKRRRLVTPTKPKKVQSQTQKINLMKSEVLTRKTVSVQESTPMTSNITRKNIVNIMKLVQGAEQQNVTIKYYLGDIVIFQQSVKKMSIIRNKIRDIYDIYQDKQMTKQVKKVSIAIGNKNFYCKRKQAETIDNPERVENFIIQQSQQKQQIHKKPQKHEKQQENNQHSEQIKGIFRINKKRVHSNPKNTITINEQVTNTQPIMPKQQKNQSIFHVRKTANSTQKKIIAAYRHQA